MNGADLLCDTLLANDVDVCFANPGTSEMHFVAALDRKVIVLQADGSGMYTPQALWTHARAELDVVTIVYSNHRYQILLGELKNIGAAAPGDNALRMLTLDNPHLDWCAMARGMGVDAARAETVETFTDLLRDACARRGPFLIEALI